MASEKEAALTAVPSDSPTIFDKIINKEIPANIVFEDEKVLAFRDIAPQAPVHIVIIPKVKDGLTGISKAEEKHCEILGQLLYTAKLITKQEALEDGFRLVINDGPKGCMNPIRYHITSYRKRFFSCLCFDPDRKIYLWTGQSVYHLQIHMLGGRQMNWPPG